MLEKLQLFIKLVQSFGPVIEKAWPLIKQLMDLFATIPQPSFAAGPKAAAKHAEDQEQAVDSFVAAASHHGIPEKEARSVALKVLGVKETGKKKKGTNEVEEAARRGGAGVADPKGKRVPEDVEEDLDDEEEVEEDEE